MARVADITDKLMFEGNPSLIIKGKKLEVNADAPYNAESYGTYECRQSWTQ